MSSRIAFVCPSNFLAPLFQESKELSLLPFDGDCLAPTSLMSVVSYLKVHAPNVQFEVFDPVVRYLEPEEFTSILYAESGRGRRNWKEIVPELDLYCKSVQMRVIDRFLDNITSFAPDYVAIPFHYSEQYGAAKSIVTMVRKALPNVKIIVGGIHATCNPEKLLMEVSEVDIVIVGEGDKPLTELVDGGPVDSLDSRLCRTEGLYYRLKDQIVFSGAREPTTNLDEFPHPYLVSKEFQLSKRLRLIELFPELLTTRMGNLVPLSTLSKIGSFSTSRGCPYLCTFCTNQRVTGCRVRFHSPEYILEVVTYMKEKLGFEGITFGDAMFSLNRKRLRILADILPPLGLTYYCQDRLDSLDDERVVLLEKIGVRCVALGIESFNPDVLAQNKKALNLDNAKLHIDNLRRHGILALGTFIVGLPGDNIPSMLVTAFMARHSGLDVAKFWPLVVVPGSEIWDSFMQQIPTENRLSLSVLLDPHEYWYTVDFSLELLNTVANCCHRIFTRHESISVELFMLLAESLQEHHHHAEAFEELTYALTRFPDNKDILTALSQIGNGVTLYIEHLNT